jgi:hypothetical protein
MGRIAQLARASPLQGEGHPFKSGFAHYRLGSLSMVGNKIVYKQKGD